MEQKEQTSPNSGTNLFDPSKTSPIPGSNLFDPAALLGASPFSAGLSALPFAHLAHLPGAFSMLGHPAFPVSSLFGRLGDGLTSPLGLSSSLVSSTSPALGKYGLFDASLAFSTPSSSSTKTVTSSSRSSGSSRSSSSTRGRRSTSGGRGRPRKLVKQPAIPLSLVQSTSILSPSMLEKYTKKRENATSNGFDSEAHSDRSSVSSLFDINFDKDSKSKKHTSPSPKSRPDRVSSGSPNGESKSQRSSSQSPPPDIVHIDSMKRKIIADQIRQRVQTKTSSDDPQSPPSGRKRRGRPPKISQEDYEESKFRQELALALKRSSNQSEMEESGNKPSSSSGEKGGKKGSGRRKSPNKAGRGTPLFDDLIATCELKVNESCDNQKSGPGESHDEDGNISSSSKFKDLFHDSTSNGSSALDSNDLDNGSLSESDLDNGSGDSDSDDQSMGKRKANDDGERPIKRRHVVLDDSKIRIPLSKGWKRQTNIHSYGRRGIVGEVWYFAPCGRKMKTIPDVMRYIERNNIADLGRDLFSFNTKVNVGEFYEARVGGGDNGFIKLTESEIEDRLSVTVSRRLKKIENQKKREKLKMQQSLAKQMLENKMKQKLEQQEMARKVAEMQFQKRLEREQQKELLKRAKQMKILEKKKQRDQMRMLRERERQQRDEQLRAKQEMRAHLLIEKRRQKQEEQQRKKLIKAMKLSEEREMKRQQAAMLKEQMRLRQEQERRRQHILLLKALEQRKKQEERERQKEEKIAERRLHRERKNEQRKMEFVLAQELKKPREDMELRDSRPLPEFPRISGNHLDGEAFADCLMSLEFLHNFAKPLGFDSQSLPSMKSLQDAVTAKTDDDAEEYMSLVTHLLRHALDEPGVPNPKEAVTKLGQKITDIEITDVILSEVLRVFMVVRNGGETELSEYLRNYPLEACSINHRAAVIAFLCNELNCGKTITAEIENHLDHMADIRRDKWVIEGKLRRLRTLRSKKFNKANKSSVVDGEAEDSVMTSISKHSDDEEDKDDASGNEDENFNEGETEEDDPTTLEECEKQIEKLRKIHFQYRDKVFKESQHVRGIELGRDRYKRNYWVLPHAGGIFVEGMESGEIKELVRPKVKCDRSEVKNLKIEVIDERTEKKGVAFLEEVEEKKAVDILNVKKESDCNDKKEILNGEKQSELGNGEIDAEVVKEEKNVIKVKNIENVSCETIKTEVCEVKDVNQASSGLDQDVDELLKANGHFENGMTDNHIKTVEKVVNGVDNKPDIICNGDLNLSDQKSPQKMSVSGKQEASSSLTSSQQTSNSESCSSETGSSFSSSQQTSNSESSHSEPGSSLSSTQQTGSSISSNFEAGKSSDHETSLGKPSKHVELKIPNIKSSAIDKDKPNGTDTSSNLFLQIPQSTKLSDFCSISIDAAIKNDLPEDKKCSETSSFTSSLFFNTSFSDHVTKSANHSASLTSTSQPPPAHSKMQASERKPNFMSIDSILEKKTGSSQSDNFYMNSVLPVNPFVSQSVRSVSENSISDCKPWFSLLPRVPCDDMSLTRDQHTSLGSGLMLSPPFMSQLPFQPFSLQSPSFSSFQMGQLFTTSVNHSQTATSSSSATVTSVTQSSDASFKKPEPVSSSQNPDPEQVLKTIQGEAKPIPEEFKKGWWKMNDPDIIQQLQKCLHPRGIREKQLQKTIQKFEDHTLASCSKTKEVMCMDSSSEEEVTDDEEEEDEENEKEENENSEENTSCTEIEMEVDGTEKSKDTDGEHNCDIKSKDIYNDNKIESGDTDIGSVNKKSLRTKSSRKKGKNKKEKQVKKKRKKKKVIPVIDCNARSEEADRLILEEVETLEDRISSASLQIKGWKLAPKTFSDESEIRIIPRWETKKDENDVYPVEAAKERLLQLESNVERRYLKPPLSKAHRISLNSMSSATHVDTYDDADSEVDFENLPVGLQMWRIAVATATSPAQLMLCVIQLINSLAWEKSIMKVLCQICRKDDNEAELLLCDGCDRGYHTYCFKPKLESIPDGDWYCFECVSKAVGESCCLVCGRRFGKMAECNLCNRCIHIDCVDPPLPRIPRKWFCAACDDCTKSSAKKRVRKNSSASSSAPSTPAADLTPTGRKRRSDFGIPRKRKSSDTTSESDSPVKKLDDNSSSKSVDSQNEKSSDKVSDKEKMKLEEQSTDLKICRVILTEMMKHEDGWPFLQPVNCKHFPSYRKYIKQPMDFGTMKIKLRDHVYHRRNEFMTDAVLTFDNCRLFNEDDSEVGQCGHNMRKFFNRRWKELVFESMSESAT